MTVAIPPPPARPGPLRIGTLELASRFTLAPLAGYTNLPFRKTVRERGGLGLATTDLVSSRALLEGSRKTMELLATDATDRPLAVQIYGAKADEMADAAKWLEERLGASSVDINMGCPVRKVVKGGGGSAMMCDTVNTVALVRAVVRATNLPVTVKMRLGWDDSNLSAPYFARAFEAEGVAGLTIHGRTREQGFGGTVNRAGIRDVVEAVERIPVLGNGDVRTLADAAAMLDETGCAGIAIGRGALLNPWIFSQLDAWMRTGDPGPSAGWHDRLACMETHFARLVEWRGDWFGCLQFRKVANWYCKALRVPRAIQQRLTQLESAAAFAELVAGLREVGPPPHWQPPGATDPAIPVPAGPIAHW